MFITQHNKALVAQWEQSTILSGYCLLELPQLNSVYIFLIINHSLQLVHNEEQNALCFRHTGQHTGHFKIFGIDSSFS